MHISGSLPRHHYIWIDSSTIRENGKGFEPAVWFAVHSHPGRVWGCHVMLECGAVYRNVPPHHISFTEKQAKEWTVNQAQLWDCYSREFSLVQYDYLSSLGGIASIVRKDVEVEYLFTAVPYGEGFSDAPDQSKEFMFLRTIDNRLTIQPTNRVLFNDFSFSELTGWPSDIKLQTNVYSCEKEF